MSVGNQRWREGRASYRPAGERIRPHLYEVAAVEEGLAREFVLAHHYSGTYPAARRRFGLFQRKRLVGVAVFSVPMNANALACLAGGATTGLELGRFVLLDAVPGNGETWFLARCFELLRSEGWEGVVSFSDPTERTSHTGEVVFGGHVGTIYQAHNAVYLGRATPRTLRVLPSGRVYSARTLQKVRARERGWRYGVDQLIAEGAPVPRSGDLRAWLAEVLPLITRSVRHGGNHKYAWALKPQARKHLPKSLPYPKLGLAQARGRGGSQRLLFPL